MRKSAYIGVTVLLLLSLAAQNAYCLDVSISGNGGSVKKSIQAGIDNQYNSLTVQGDGFTLDDWSLSGSDDKYLKNKVSTGSNAQEVIVANSGNANIQGSSATDSSIIVSTLGGQADGNGNLMVISESQENIMMVAADGKDLNVEMDVVAAQGASISGEVSMNGMECLDKDTSSFISSGSLGMKKSGLYMNSDGKIGELNLVALNQPKVSEGQKPSAGIIRGTYNYYNDAKAWVPLLNYDPYNQYVLDGAIWKKTISAEGTGPNVQLYFNPNGMPASLDQEQTTTAIANAATTWDSINTKDSLFLDSIITDTSAGAGIPDQKNVHQWADLSDPEAIAMSTTWLSGEAVRGANRKPYYRITESDVEYNINFDWTNDIDATDLYRVTNIPFKEGMAISTGNKMLVQSIALHELGHTMGLGDTYLHPTYKYDLSQIMTFYTGPKTTLGSGDKAGITALYG